MTEYLSSRKSIEYAVATRGTGQNEGKPPRTNSRTVIFLCDVTRNSPVATSENTPSESYQTVDDRVGDDKSEPLVRGVRWTFTGVGLGAETVCEQENQNDHI